MNIFFLNKDESLENNLFDINNSQISFSSNFYLNPNYVWFPIRLCVRP